MRGVIALSLVLRTSLFVFAACAVGLVSFVCVELHDSFVKYAMVAASVCLALELNSLPLIALAGTSLNLRRVIAAADSCVFALSLAAGIVMARESHTARVGRAIHALTPARAHALFAAIAFLWTQCAVALVVLFANLREIGRDELRRSCDAGDDGAPSAETSAANTALILYEKHALQTYAELALAPAPGALARAVAVPYV